MSDAIQTKSQLLDEWVRTGVWPPGPAPEGGWTPPRLYAAIEAEVCAADRAALAAKITALRIGQRDYADARCWDEAIDNVLALLEEPR